MSKLKKALERAKQARTGEVREKQIWKDNPD